MMAIGVVMVALALLMGFLDDCFDWPDSVTFFIACQGLAGIGLCFSSLVVFLWRVVP